MSTIEGGGGGSSSVPTYAYGAPTAVKDAAATNISQQLAYEQERDELEAKLGDPINYQTAGAGQDLARREKDQKRLDFLNKQLEGRPEVDKLHQDQQKLDQKQKDLKEARQARDDAKAALDEAFPDGRPQSDTSSISGIENTEKNIKRYEKLSQAYTDAQEKVHALVTGIGRLKDTVKSDKKAAKDAYNDDVNGKGDKQKYDAGSVHTVKPGDTLWDTSRNALKAQGVANPTDAQIAAGVKAIVDANRADPGKRGQFPDVKIDDAHQIGKNPDLIHPGEKVLIPDLSKVIYPGKQFKWDPTRNQLVEVDPAKEKEKAQAAADKKDANASVQAYEAQKHHSDDYINSHPVLKKWLHDGKPASGVSDVAKEYHQVKKDQTAADNADTAYNGLQQAGTYEAQSFLKEHPVYKKWLDDGKPASGISAVAKEYRAVDAVTPKDRTDAQSAEKAYEGIRQAGGYEADAFLKDNPVFAKWLDDGMPSSGISAVAKEYRQQQQS